MHYTTVLHNTVLCSTSLRQEQIILGNSRHLMNWFVDGVPEQAGGHHLDAPVGINLKMGKRHISRDNPK